MCVYVEAFSDPSDCAGEECMCVFVQAFVDPLNVWGKDECVYI